MLARRGQDRRRGPESLQRLGRSLGQVLDVIDRLIHKGVRLASIKEAIRFEGKQNLQTKAMIVLFGFLPRSNAT